MMVIHSERIDGTARLFGRQKGHALKGAQKRRMQEVFPDLRLSLDDAPPPDLAQLFSDHVDAVVLEIGFGGGEHLIARATNAQNTGFIGVEPFVNGVAKLVSAVDERALKNVRIHDNDARELLDWLPTGSIARIDILYPDPWPKRRHWKRRFISPANLDRFARVLREGGDVRFASDIPTYVAWTLSHMRRHPAFSWCADQASDWREPWEGWPGTRYEQKAIREGRRPHYLTFRRLPEG